MITLLGLTAGSLSVVSFIPQIVRIIRTRSTKDISIYMYLIFLTGSVLWFIYGLLIHALAVIATNISLICLISVIIALKSIYR